MNEDHWTVTVEGHNQTTFYGPFIYFIEAYWWARGNLTEAYNIRFQNMSPFRG